MPREDYAEQLWVAAANSSEQFALNPKVVWPAICRDNRLLLSSVKKNISRTCILYRLHPCIRLIPPFLSEFTFGLVKT